MHVETWIYYVVYEPMHYLCCTYVDAYDKCFSNENQNNKSVIQLNVE